MYTNPGTGLGIEVVGTSCSSIISGRQWWGSCDAYFDLGGWLTITERLSIWNELSTYE